MAGYGAIDGERRNTSSRLNAPLAAVALAACAAVLVVVAFTSQQDKSVELADFPKTDLGLLRVLVCSVSKMVNSVQVLCFSYRHSRSRSFAFSRGAD